MQKISRRTPSIAKSLSKYSKNSPNPLQNSGISTRENCSKESILHRRRMHRRKEVCACCCDGVSSPTKVFNFVGCIGEIVNRFPCVLFRAETFPLHKPLLSLASLVVTFGYDVLDFPFFVAARVVIDDVGYWSRVSAICILLVGFEMSNRYNWVNFPRRRNVQFVGEAADRAKDLEGTDSLGW